LAGFGLIFVGGSFGRFYLGRRRSATATGEIEAVPLGNGVNTSFRLVLFFRFRQQLFFFRQQLAFGPGELEIGRGFAGSPRGGQEDAIIKRYGRLFELRWLEFLQSGESFIVVALQMQRVGVGGNHIRIGGAWA